MKDLRISKGLVFILLAAFCTGAYFLSHKPSPCQGPWNSPEEMMACKFPNPPIGSWKAVYSEEFAKEHNLPPENISTDLSPDVDYMEMDVQPYAENGVACLVNMLIKRPNDVAFFSLSSKDNPEWNASVNDNRKLLHFIDIEAFRPHLKYSTAFNATSRDYSHDSGFRSTTFAFYAEDVLSGYDYVSTNFQCYNVIKSRRFFPDNYAIWVAKASVWGKYKTAYISENTPGHPRGQAFFDSHFFIHVPQDLPKTIFKDMPIGGQ